AHVGSMVRKEILVQVIQVVGVTLEVAEGVELTEDTNLKELGADSFDLLELVTALEDEFGLTLDDDDVEKIATIGQVVDAIKNAE
ncbi:acyl carrier protein, partial [Paratractidigestivibacter sp.]|uniref:acyl carrier protein n=1 Tax=Paratractidigestivibacter sp. TaxID=2847316 RepID=UPI004026A0D6